MVSDVAAQRPSMRKAEKLYKRGKYAAAAEMFKLLYARKNDDFVAARVGECYLSMRDFVQANEWYFKLEQSNALHPVDRYNYGQVLKAFGRYDDARQQFQGYLDQYPNDTAAQRLYASCTQAQELGDSAIYYRAEPADDLNSPASDFSPVYYRDGLVFVSSRQGGNSAGTSPFTGQPYTDLYYSNSLADRAFSSPQLLPGNLNSMLAEGPVSFSRSQDTVYFTRLVDRRGQPVVDRRGRNYYKLFMATRSAGDEWNNITQLRFTTDDEFHYMHPSVSADGTRLFFTTNRTGGYGGFDIWVSELFNGRWGDPYNLGPTLNTEGQEGYPFMHADGTLYFSSDLREGFGGYDVFAAHERYNAFTNIENFRLGINSPRDDYGVIMNEDKSEGFVTSNRDGDDDIYFIFRVNIPRIDRIREQELLAMNQPDQEAGGNNDPSKINGDNTQYLVVSGQVVELLAQRNGNDWNKTQGAILDNALIVLMNAATGRAEQSQPVRGGRYAFEVENPANYVLIAKSEGHFATRIPLNASQRELAQMTIQLEKIVLNEPNPNGLMPNVNFSFDSYGLSEAMRTQLTSISRIIKDNPEMVLELAGHACRIGDSRYNQQLSEKRALAVAQYLTQQHAIPNSRLIVRGYGETRPLYPNAPEVRDHPEAALNRRTEFIVRSLNNRAPGITALNDVEVSRPSAQALAQVEEFQRHANTALLVENNRPANTPLNAPNTQRPVVFPSGDGWHTVSAGQTLYSIARANTMTVDALMRINNLTSTNIRVGQRLRIR
jgi:outer membrane protein OmpA-like peptidoglycan-associated protein